MNEKPAVKGLKAKRFHSFREFGVIIVLVVMFIIMSLASPFFLRAANLLNIVRQIAEISIMAIGMTFVINNAQIDLSVGSVYGFTGVLGAILVRDVLMHPAPALLIMLLAGIMAGLINGLITTKLRVPAFIVTLSTMQILRSSALGITGGLNVSAFPETAINNWVFGIGRHSVGGIPLQVLIMIGLIITSAVILAKSRYGFKVYATGGNKNAARLSGINTDNVIIGSFVITGFCAAIASLIGLTFLHSMPATAGTGREMDVIAAVILGGTQLSGGRGTILGTFIGSMIMGVVRNGMVLIGVPAFYQPGFIGIIILLAVISDTWISRKDT